MTWDLEYSRARRRATTPAPRTEESMIHVESACNPDALHDHARAPIRVDEWRCGTNGIWVLASRDDLAAQEAHPRTAAIIREWLADVPDGWREELTAELRARMGRPLLPEPCPNCSGSGAWRNGAYMDSAEGASACDVCWLCDDAGCVIGETIPRVVQWGEWQYDCRRIAWLLAHVATPSVRLRQCGEVLVMRWHDGAAALMRCVSGQQVAEVWT